MEEKMVPRNSIPHECPLETPMPLRDAGELIFQKWGEEGPALWNGGGIRMLINFCPYCSQDLKKTSAQTDAHEH
jgi:hypothetical protein